MNKEVEINLRQKQKFRLSRLYCVKLFYAFQKTVKCTPQKKHQMEEIRPEGDFLLSLQNTQCHEVVKQQ